MNHIFKSTETESTETESTEHGDFNLDFKTIPHWEDASILEKNWSGMHTKAIKSVLALIVEEPSTGYIPYINAEIKPENQSEAVIEFVDFWRDSHGVAPKMLIFDYKFTTYEKLNILNKSSEPIKFLTLRRRGKNLVERVEKIPESLCSRIKFFSKKLYPRSLLKLREKIANIEL